MQLTLHQSLQYVAVAEVWMVFLLREMTAINPGRDKRPSSLHVSSQPETYISADSSDSDDFREPDPDSTDEWLPSGSTGSRRDSSPETKRRNDEGNLAAS